MPKDVIFKYASGDRRLRVLLHHDVLHLHDDPRRGGLHDVHSDDGCTNRCNPIHCRTKFHSRGQGRPK